jgi:hypothetical protein
VKLDPAKEIVSFWTVGFTGHRKLANEQQIASAIAAQLELVRSHVTGELAAISSIASGGDTLFAQQVLAAGLPWIALLPFPREEFAHDFEPEAWRTAQECLSRATAEEVWSSEADRRHAYQDVGINTVDEADIVFAVWDGNPAKGPGGTAEMVAYARQHQKPLVWIHAETAVATRENWPRHPFTDEVFRSLLELPAPKISKAASSTVDAFFHRLDEAATKGIPKVRSLETRVIAYNSGATLIAGVALALHWDAFDLATLNGICVILGFAAAWRLHRQRHSGALVEARLIAEICRSLEATWFFPDRFAHLYRCHAPHLSHLVRSLLLNRDCERRRLQPANPAPDILVFRDEYTRTRLKDQLKYFRKERLKSLPRIAYYARTAFLASLGAVIVACVVEYIGCQAVHNPFPLLTSFWPHLDPALTHGVVAPDWKLLALLGVAAPLIASFCTSLLSVNEYKRRDSRYHEMAQILETSERRLRHVASPRAIKQIVVDTETALLSEIYQWYYQAIDRDDV